jgi:hypothetical protein
MIDYRVRLLHRVGKLERAAVTSLIKRNQKKAYFPLNPMGELRTVHAAGHCTVLFISQSTQLLL